MGIKYYFPVPSYNFVTLRTLRCNTLASSFITYCTVHPEGAGGWVPKESITSCLDFLCVFSHKSNEVQSHRSILDYLVPGRPPDFIHTKSEGPQAHLYSNQLTQLHPPLHLSFASSCRLCRSTRLDLRSVLAEQQRQMIQRDARLCRVVVLTTLQKP